MLGLGLGLSCGLGFSCGLGLVIAGLDIVDVGDGVLGGVGMEGVVCGEEYPFCTPGVVLVASEVVSEGTVVVLAGTGVVSAGEGVELVGCASENSSI